MGTKYKTLVLILMNTGSSFLEETVIIITYSDHLLLPFKEVRLRP